MSNKVMQKSSEEQKSFVYELNGLKLDFRIPMSKTKIQSWLEILEEAHKEVSEEMNRRFPKGK